MNYVLKLFEAFSDDMQFLLHFSMNFSIVGHCRILVR